MASFDQLIQHIRFGLSTLSEKNGHHDFEHLCRFLARARICSNILPSTGPVASGGDQGRDFETFRTFIQSSSEYAFVGVTANKRLVFACSLDKEPLSKCKADILKIMETGSLPDCIYFFSSHSITTAQRHAAIEWARQTHSVELEILDAVAISELLANSDVFWIAARYLDVPVEIFPATDEPEGEYGVLREKWFAKDVRPERFADYVEVKRAARYALSGALQDMAGWLSLLDGYSKQGRVDIGTEQATYEYLVLTLRSRRTFSGEETRVREFLSNLERFDLPDMVEQAETVLAYALGSRLQGAGNFEVQELQNWHDKLISIIEQGIHTAVSANQLCRWLLIQGRAIRNFAICAGKPDELKDAFKTWERLLEIVPEAPLFPIADFHEEMLQTAEMMPEKFDLSPLIEKLRPILAQAAGNGAVADSHFKRAEQLSKKGKIGSAIRELHSAKIRWLAEDTVGHSAQCCLLLAHYYNEYGLHVAAIYFSLAASYIFANAEGDLLREHIHEGLHDAAESAYLQGHWCLFYELSMPAVFTQLEMSPDGLNADQSMHLRWYLRNLPLALDATDKLAPSVASRAIEEVKARGLEPTIREAFAEAKRKTSACSSDVFLSALQNHFTGAPLEDCGANCRTTWKAHGIIWRFEWENTYEAFRVAMEVVSCIQVALADFAEIDLDIIPGEFHAFLEMTNEVNLSIQSVPDNSRYSWRFLVPRNVTAGMEQVEAFSMEIIATVLEILRTVSVMPSARFTEIFSGKDGALGNSFFARRFPELLDFFAARERFGALGRNEPVSLSWEGWMPRARSGIPWVDTLHPKFNEEEELKRIRRRYDVAGKSTQFTIKRLLADYSFVATLAELRSRGWKDWHVLMAVCNLAANYRVRLKWGDAFDDDNVKNALWREMTEDEKIDSVEVPASEFKADDLEMFLLNILFSTISSEGLTLRQLTPNRAGLFQYMRIRWKYFDLDVEHHPLSPHAETLI